MNIIKLSFICFSLILFSSTIDESVIAAMPTVQPREEIRQSNTKIDDVAKQQKIDAASKSYDSFVIIYSVALGFIGLFNMYNCLSIYNKKEQYDRELNSIINQHKEDSLMASINHKEYRLEIDKMYCEIEKNVASIGKDIEKKTDDHIGRLKDEFQVLLEKLKSNNEAVIDKIDTDFDNWKKNITDQIRLQEHEFNRHLYTYYLYSFIPNYLIDKNNRIAVHSAFNWFSQHATIDDLSIVEERLKCIPSGDSELINVCSHTIKIITQKLASANVSGRDSHGQNVDKVIT